MKDNRIDEARKEAALKNPELIVRTTAWSLELVCATCEMELDPEGKYISHPTGFSFTGSQKQVHNSTMDLIEDLKCPHCKKSCDYGYSKLNEKSKHGNHYIYERKFSGIEPLPHKIYKVRKVITREASKEKTGWFSSIKIPELSFEERILLKEINCKKELDSEKEG